MRAWRAMRRVGVAGLVGAAALWGASQFVAFKVGKYSTVWAVLVTRGCVTVVHRRFELTVTDANAFVRALPRDLPRTDLAWYKGDWYLEDSARPVAGFLDAQSVAPTRVVVSAAPGQTGGFSPSPYSRLAMGMKGRSSVADTSHWDTWFVHWHGERDATFVRVELWPSAVLVAIGGAIWLRNRRKARPGCCAGCGYSLAGLPVGASVCPECGGGIGFDPKSAKRAKESAAWRIDGIAGRFRSGL